MIYINWVYKGSVIQTDTVDVPYTSEECISIREDFASGGLEVSPPENYERYFLSAEPIGKLYVG